jgi:hypothetical protein
VEWCLKGLGLFEYSFWNRILIGIPNIGKTHGFQRATGCFLVTENTTLPRILRIDFSGCGRRD